MTSLESGDSKFACNKFVCGYSLNTQLTQGRWDVSDNNWHINCPYRQARESTLANDRAGGGGGQLRMWRGLPPGDSVQGQKDVGTWGRSMKGTEGSWAPALLNSSSTPLPSFMKSEKADSSVTEPNPWKLETLDQEQAPSEHQHGGFNYSLSESKSGVFDDFFKWCKTLECPQSTKSPAVHAIVFSK